MENNDFDTLSGDEFRKLGYLQEVNRRFFHPLGLAMAANVDSTGAVVSFSILDDREDKMGFIYDIAKSDDERKERFKRNAKFIDDEIEKRSANRIDYLGMTWEPIP